MIPYIMGLLYLLGLSGKTGKNLMMAKLMDWILGF